MRCPYCTNEEDRVVDSRANRDGLLIRRRRECLGCQRRYTTYERIEELATVIVKKDGRREPYDRAKILHGLTKACEKRPVPVTVLNEIADRVERHVLDRGDAEVSSRSIGEAVMEHLHRVDQVAYVRFASVYRDFKDVTQFLDELTELLKRERVSTEGPSI